MSNDATEKDAARLEWFATHCMRDASIRLDDEDHAVFRARTAWAISSDGKDLRAAIDDAIAEGGV